MKTYPEKKFTFILSLDTKSLIKSLWLGWILICWWEDYPAFKGEHKLGKWIWTVGIYPYGE